MVNHPDEPLNSPYNSIAFSESTHETKAWHSFSVILIEPHTRHFWFFVRKLLPCSFVLKV
jgi:hypothetical protein